MKSPLETYFTALQGKRLIVLGLGVSNRPLVRLMLRYGCTVIGCDRTPREKLDAEVLELEEKGCELRLGDTYLENLSGDVVFRTPGMHPDNPALVDLREAGAEVTSEMEVFFTLCPCTTIAVTGSDGKTTTTTLISEMLKAAGKTVWLGGNIGTPLLPKLDEIAQLGRNFDLTPVIAHVDRYMSMMKDESLIDRVLRRDLVVQVNSAYFLNPKTQKKAFANLKAGRS